MKTALQKQIIFKITAFIFLAFITIFFVKYIGLYKEFGPELLKNNDFSRGFTDWERWGPKGAIKLEDGQIVRLHSNDKRSSINLVQQIKEPERFGLLKISGDIRTDSVRAGEEDWHTARLMLVSYDAGGRWLPVPHVVASLKGNNPLKRYSKVFNISDNARELRVNAQMMHSSGSMWVKNLSLKEAVKKPFYDYWQATYWLWIFFLLWLLIPLIAGCRGIIIKGMVTLTVAAILFGTLTPRAATFKLREDSLRTFKKMTGTLPSKEAPVKEKKGMEREEIEERWRLTNKSGHFLLFVILACCLAAGFPYGGRSWPFLVIVILAAATELMQYHVEGRMPYMRDWFLDIAGATSGLALFYIAGMIMRVRKEKGTA